MTRNEMNSIQQLPQSQQLKLGTIKQQHSLDLRLLSRIVHFVFTRLLIKQRKMVSLQPDKS